MDLEDALAAISNNALDGSSVGIYQMKQTVTFRNMDPIYIIFSFSVDDTHHSTIVTNSQTTNQTLITATDIY